VYFLAELLVHILFLTAESHFFTLKYAFYYAVNVKVGSPLSCCNISAGRIHPSVLQTAASSLLCKVTAAAQKPAARLLQIALLMVLCKMIQVLM
jgi:hypothetical protein